MSKFADDRIEKLAEEMKKQSNMLKEIERNLKEFAWGEGGRRECEENKLQCTFWSTVIITASQDTSQIGITIIGMCMMVYTMTTR